ncbi:uncharacterized protein LOC111818434 [Octodon degus]|uniref:Uncharacterized protein LOC111818434 n=1 Tax=Octodon degus TaxID=10160 RepID=A0A6P6F124_OCTDE|nr:uncharacterized protein LOC111818434 [Octodon degus]
MDAEKEAAAVRPGARCGRPSSGAEAAVGTTQRPGEGRAAPAAVGISARHGRGLASITADLPRPPCWEETTRHAAAERLQRRKRRRRRRLPRAAVAPGGRGRRAARVAGPEPQRYGGPAGSRRLLRSSTGGVGRGGRPAAPKLARGAPPGGRAAEPETPVLPSPAGLIAVPAALHRRLWLLGDPVRGSAVFLRETTASPILSPAGFHLPREDSKFRFYAHEIAVQDRALRLPRRGFSAGKRKWMHFEDGNVE